MNRLHGAFLALMAVVAASTTPASASTAEQWAAFKRDVFHRCAQAVLDKKIFPAPYLVMVGDYGTLSYGVAMVYRSAPSGGTAGQRVPPDHLVCVYRKAPTSAATTVELSDFVPPY
jgi:hypothetical protein